MQRRQLFLRLIVLFIPALLAGCSANHHSIYRMRPLGLSDSTLTTVDAKQRAILTTFVDGRLRACAEASPDFASVIAQSLSATGSFGQSADPASVQAAASLAASSSEQGATIQRTQAVNLMRELLYRDCEQYLAADSETRALAMPIQAVRTQRIIVSLAGIDGITGAASPGPVIIGASAGASAGSSPGEAVVRRDDARQALAAADATQRTRQADYDTLQNAAPSCTAIETKAATAGQTLTAEETTKRTQCANALTALNTAKADRQSKSERYEELNSGLTSGGGGPASTTTTVQTGDHGVGEAARAQGESVARVALAVEHIVDQAYAQDEFGLFCLRFLDRRDDQLRQACLDYLTARVRLEAAQANSRAAQLYRADFSSTYQAVQTADDALFDAFWTRAAPGGTLDRGRLVSMVDTYIQSVNAGGWGPSDAIELGQLKAASDRATARRIFATLSDRSREALGRREN